VLGRAFSLVAAVAAALICAATASAYPWPLAPFDQPHPVRENFGDPSTLFAFPAGTNVLDGPGEFSFRNGVDIAASPGTAVYPVVSGRVTAVEFSKVVVSAAAGASFQYAHVQPLVSVGQIVAAQTTVLGVVEAPADRIHFAEFQDGSPVNPLARRHLVPYRDRIRPRVRSIQFRSTDGRTANVLALRGEISVVVEAYDTPSVPARSGWRAFRVAPAMISWRLATGAGELVVPETIAVDFLNGLPPNTDFWNVYARGTYQNDPVLGLTTVSGMPGRYLFTLTPKLFDTRQLRRGLYILTVAAYDVRGNYSTRSARFTVLPETKH
jgi:Peptidase family M23